MAHTHSVPVSAVAHQTVSRTTPRWDRQLVPGAAGEVDRPTSTCPVEVALGAVRGRWTTLVLRELMHDERSFGDLRDALPTLSDKVLADRLRQLVADGLADRMRTQGFPSRVYYRLTPTGAALRPLLVELYRTGERVTAKAGAAAPT